MSLDLVALLAALESHAAASGYFEAVNGHEPNNAPGTGLTAAVWLDDIRPAAGSGLASTTARITCMVRIYAPAIQQPQDGIDPAVVSAVDHLMRAYSGDFTLDGLIRNVDLLGQTGDPMSARAGWLPFPDGGLYRVMTITVPLIINDLWDQAE
jgi:hypothetical protein